MPLAVVVKNEVVIIVEVMVPPCELILGNEVINDIIEKMHRHTIIIEKTGFLI